MSLFRVLFPEIKQNWKVVMLSIGGATTFWLFNAMSKTYETRIDYPVAFEFNRDSVVITEPLAETVKVEVSSRGWNLFQHSIKFSPEPIKITLLEPTKIKFIPRQDLIQTLYEQLSGFKLLSVITDTLKISVEQKLSARLPIYVDSLSIPLEEGYRIISPIGCKLDSVEFIGPASNINQLKKEKRVKVSFYDEEINYNINKIIGFEVDEIIESKPSGVFVNFTVAKYIEKNFDIPVEFLYFPNDSSVIPKETVVKISFLIDENDEDDITIDDFSITADYSLRNKKDSTIMPVLMYAPQQAIELKIHNNSIGLSYLNKK